MADIYLALEASLPLGFWANRTPSRSRSYFWKCPTNFGALFIDGAKSILAEKNAVAAIALFEYEKLGLGDKRLDHALLFQTLG